MSDQQHIDDLFKRGFEDYAPQVPEGTFERIIEQRKKRRGAIVWWRDWRNLKFLVIFVTIALVAGSSFLILKEQKNGTTQSSDIAQPTSNTKARVANNDNEETIAQPVVEEQSLPAAIPTASDAPNDIASGKSSIQVQALTGDNSSKGSNAANDIASGNSSTQPGPATLDNSSNTGSDLSGRPSLAPVKNTSRGGKTFARKGTKAGGRTLVNTSATDVETADADNYNEASESSPLADQQNALLKLYRMPVDFALITASSLADSSKAVVTNSIKGPDCPEAEKNAAGNKTYWEAYTSADYASKKYLDTANSLFATKRKETTSFHSAFSFGVRVTKVFNNGVSVRTGLNFSQINEKFSFVQSNTVQTTYIIDAVTGDTTGSYIVRGTKYKTSFNRYRTLDVPLVIGYEVGNGRLHANFNAGAIINVYSWQKGELLDTAFQPVSITTGKGLPAFQYKTNIGVGFTAGASVYYKLNDRLHLLAEPYFRYNFSPMNKEALSLQERFTTIGLRLGIRIDF